MMIGWSGPGTLMALAVAVMALSPSGTGPLTPRSTSLPLPQIVGRRRRPPDVARHRHPNFRPLRLVAVPRPRIEVAERLVHHLVELGEQLDDLVVRVAVIGEDVVARPVPPRPPDDWNIPRAEVVACGLHVRPVLELERDVMHARGLALHEVHRVMIGAAAHEHEPVLDPVGHAEAEHAAVEIGECLRIVDGECEMAELE